MMTFFFMILWVDLTWAHHVAAFIWRLNWTGRSKMTSVTCLVLAVSWVCSKLVWFSYMAVLEAEFSEGKDGRIEDLLKPKLWNLCNINSTTFHRSKRVTRPAQVQGSGETDTTFGWEERQNHIAKEHAKWNGRNLWLLKILLHFGRTPILIKAIHSPTPWTCPQSSFKEMLYSFPLFWMGTNIGRKFRGNPGGQ